MIYLLALDGWVNCCPSQSPTGWTLCFPFRKKVKVLDEVIIPPKDRVSRELVLEEMTPPLDMKATFGNDNPVELEIGIGKGYFIMNAGVKYPDRNFIGIEIRRKYLMNARERVEKRPISNVRFVNGEAFSFMETFLKPESLSVIHLYFPDPWPKKRHHKRRLFSPDFLTLVKKTLIPGGQILIATDHKDYWEWICEILDNQDFLVKCDRLPEPVDGSDGLTNYEIKYTREGRPIYRVGYKKP